MDKEIRHTNQELIEFIKKRRDELGLTQAELAKRAGIGQPYVSKIESGVIRSPSSFTIDSLAKALEVNVDELWNTTLCIPDDGEIGYCPNYDCPGSEWIGDHNNAYWEPYKTSLEDDEGHIEFCVHCGNKLLTECQNCGRKIKRFYRYCPGCGHSLMPVSVNTSQKEEADDDDVPF